MVFYRVMDNEEYYILSTDQEKTNQCNIYIQGRGKTEDESTQKFIENCKIVLKTVKSYLDAILNNEIKPNNGYMVISIGVEDDRFCNVTLVSSGETDEECKNNMIYNCNGVCWYIDLCIDTATKNEFMMLVPHFEEDESDFDNGCIDFEG